MMEIETDKQYANRAYFTSHEWEEVKFPTYSDCFDEGYDSCQMQLQDKYAKIEKLESQLEKAVEVIRFYNDYCGGKRARQFLETLKQEKE